MARTREFDDALLRAAATDLFWSNGYEKTSVAQISAATRISGSSIYGAYGSKRELFLAVFGPYCDSRVGIVTRAMASTGDAVDAVGEFLRAVIADCADQPGRRGCLMLNSIAEFGARDEAVLRLAQEANGRMVREIAGRISGARFARAHEVTALATQILLTSQSLIAASRLRTPRAELERVAEVFCRQLALA